MYILTYTSECNMRFILRVILFYLFNGFIVWYSESMNREWSRWKNVRNNLKTHDIGHFHSRNGRFPLAFSCEKTVSDTTYLFVAAEMILFLLLSLKNHFYSHQINNNNKKYYGTFSFRVLFSLTMRNFSRWIISMSKQ